jgi:hypothetical protein
MSRSLPRRLLLIAMLALLAMAGSGYAAERHGTAAGKPAKSLAGTWDSAEGAITFKANGTVDYEGKRYYYAATSGGLIQLSRKGNSRAIPYQLSGGKLTLTVNGKVRVYFRR